MCQMLKPDLIFENVSKYRFAHFLERCNYVKRGLERDFFEGLALVSVV